MIFTRYRIFKKSNTDSLYYNNISIYELKLKVLTDLKNNFSKTKENIKTNLDEQKKKVWEIMKSLESDLKYIRENLTKENLVEMKAKAEELKTTYLAKVSEAFPNLDEAKKVIENRFKNFL